VAGAFQRVNDLVQDHPTWKLLQKWCNELLITRLYPTIYIYIYIYLYIYVAQRFVVAPPPRDGDGPYM
jgi:hypothetical protein